MEMVVRSAMHRPGDRTAGVFGTERRQRLRNSRSGFHDLHRGNRNGGGVWQAHLLGSAKTGLVLGEDEGGYRRRRRMDLDSGRRTLSLRDSNCGSLPCSERLWEVARQLCLHEEIKTESLDEGPPEAPAEQGKDRKTAGHAAGHRNDQFPKWPRSFAPRPITSKETRSACAIPSFVASTCLLARV